MQGGKKHVYMHGVTDGELRKIFKQVSTWKFDLSGEKPEISVLSKDSWIKLQKPRKSYEEIIMTALITLNFLHLLKKNPELSGEVLWDKLSRIFSSYANRPGVNDLVDHKALIKKAVKQDVLLTKSKYLMAFLKDKLLTEKRTDEDALTKEKRKFIVDDNGSSENEDSSSEDEHSSSDEEDSSGEQEESGDEEEVGDSVCCICDNGGSLLLCEGICMRSFHPTKEAAKEAADSPKSRCVSLGFSKEEVKGMPIFKCKNCLYQRHQCFSCGKLGSSDKSSGAGVFQCGNATCGYFYHPRCVAKLLNRDSEAAVEELQDKILAGESFTCPLHICSLCKRPEDKTVHQLQMAVCRRCPKAYHRKCLPRNIAFEENKKEGIIQRAWDEDLLVDRILIYCLKHEILKDLKTPERNHIKFPDDEKREEQLSAAALKKCNLVSKKKKPSVGETCQTETAMQSKKRTTEDRHLDKRNDRKISKPRRPETTTGELPNEICNDLRTAERNHINFHDDEKREEQQSLAVALKEDNVVSRKNKRSLGETCHTGTATQSKKRTVEYSHMDKRNDKKFSKMKGSDTTRKLHNEKKSRLTQVLGSSRAAEHEASLGDRLFEFYSPLLDSVKPSKSDKLDEGKLTKTSKQGLNKVYPQLDSDSEQRILDLMKEASSKINLPDVIEKYGKPTSGMDSNKTIRQGEVERFCEAIRAAVKRLDEGGSIEDAKAICEPKVLNVVDSWKEKLRVYLAPFLLGSCYTSFGRHFSKIDKLKEIVDRIHYYVKDGDTIVDFCCGANDFSCLMKEKLEEMGKRCSYKNYDLLPAKNDFNVEVRSWFTVEPHELPSGSQLIIGLNPPFGVRGERANKFFDHALKFKPKLLILIAPPEAERLDKRKTDPYDLIWEDNRILSGKSFYLPGSVDVNDKQVEDWNKVPPVLYLWSHPDWTHTHKAIAEKLDQLRGFGERDRSKWVRDSPSDDHDDGNAVGMEVDHSPPRNHPPEGQKERVASKRADDIPRNKHASDIPGNRGRENQGPRKTDDHKDRSNPNDHEARKEANDTAGNSGRGNQDLRRRRRSSEEEHEREEGAIENLPEHKRHRGSPSHYNHRGPRHFPRSSGNPRVLPDRYSSRHQGSPSNYERVCHRNQASYPYDRLPGNYTKEVDGLASKSQRERELVVWEPRPSNNGPRNSAEWGPGNTREQYQSTSGCREPVTLRPENHHVATARVEPCPLQSAPPEMGPTAGGSFNGYQAPPPRGRGGYSGDPTMGFAYGPLVNSYSPEYHGASGGWLRR